MAMFETRQRAGRGHRDRLVARARRAGRHGLGGRAAVVVLTAVVILLAVTALLAGDPAFHDGLRTFVRGL
ncbi:hypothetical protein ACFYZJ_01190 [Streptomyces sp. NPDC001848]|uniref:hypothetical protein n=1 Tax=Streptomyces sp. NPDC001848 TaxID=3364618 RepID=UPI00367403A5